MFHNEKESGGRCVELEDVIQVYDNRCVERERRVRAGVWKGRKRGRWKRR